MFLSANLGDFKLVKLSLLWLNSGFDGLFLFIEVQGFDENPK